MDPLSVPYLAPPPLYSLYVAPLDQVSLAPPRVSYLASGTDTNTNRRQHRGAIRADLDRLRQRITSKAERVKTLRVLADECWAEGEPSIGRDTLDNLEVRCGMCAVE